jgi:type I restriction enzyme S subunit
MVASSSMECGGNNAALADLALGPVPEDLPSSERVEEPELPEGWRFIPFTETICHKTARAVKVQQSNYRKSGRFPIIDQGQEFIAGYWDSEDDVYREHLPVIVFGDHTRVFKFVDFPFVAGADGTHVLVPDTNRFDPFFLYLALSSLDIQSRGYNRHFRLLKERSIVTPPLPEQRAIAAVLQTVQGAKEACEQVLAATRQLKQSLLHHLFTYGPVPFADAAHVPLKATEIGEVPESWRPTTLGQVADVGYGVQAAVAHLTDSSKGIPILTNVNITRGGAIDLTTLRYYELAEAKRDRFTLRKGDVLFNWRSGSQEHVGKTALFMLDGEYTHSSFILRMRCSEAIRPQFLAKYLHWLRSRRYFARTRQQSSVNSVFNKSLSETIPVLLPSLETQDEIAAQLSAVDAKLAAEETRRAALAALFQSLLHHLMTGTVRLPEFAKARP